MTFLFWNLHERPLQSVVTTLARRHRVDVILLAEWKGMTEPGALLPALNAGTRADFFSASTSKDSVAVYSRFPTSFMEAPKRDRRYTIWRLSLPARKGILLVAAHLVSKLFSEDIDQTNECIKLSEAIQEEERKAGHSRTLVVGDLNLNPFEDGVACASGLNAVMTKRLAAPEIRKVRSTPYPLFYNPMWRLFGDRGSGPPGTYYYASSNQVCYFWNMFDQVLVRPALADALDGRSPRILDSDGRASFLNDAGVPDSEKFSDHLPIVFSLAL